MRIEGQCQYTRKSGAVDLRRSRRQVARFYTAEVLKEKGAGLAFYTGCADLVGLNRNWPDAEVIAKPVPLRLVIAAVQAASSGTFRLSMNAAKSDERGQEFVKAA